MYPVSTENTQKKQIKKTLSSISRDVVFSYPNQDWPDTEGETIPSSWLNTFVSSGLRVCFGYRALSESFNIPHMNSNECDPNDGFWLEHGFFLRKTGVFYALVFSDDIINNEKMGLLIPSGLNIYTASAQSKDPIHMASQKLMVEMERLSFSSRGVRDAVLKDGILGFRVGSNITPYKKINTIISDSCHVSSVDESIAVECWTQPIKKCIEHLSLSKKGRLCFLSGDYTKDLTSMLLDRVGDMTMLRASRISDAPGVDADVYFFSDGDFNASGLKALRDVYERTSSYIVFVFSSKNITHLLSKSQRLFSSVELILDWGGHAIRVAIPKICDKCKKQIKSQDLTVDLVNFTKTFDRSSSTGQGCASCVNGYSGIAFASEDIWGVSVFSSILSDAYADQDESDKIGRLAISPYKIANDLYKKESVSSLATSIVSLVSSGIVKVDDAQEVLG
jgi:hypothetical protein